MNEWLWQERNKDGTQKFIELANILGNWKLVLPLKLVMKYKVFILLSLEKRSIKSNKRLICSRTTRSVLVQACPTRKLLSLVTWQMNRFQKKHCNLSYKFSLHAVSLVLAPLFADAQINSVWCLPFTLLLSFFTFLPRLLSFQSNFIFLSFSWRGSWTKNSVFLLLKKTLGPCF